MRALPAAALLACLAAAAAAAPGADAQQLSPFESKFGAVKFLDAYFGQPGSKLEVRPGDSNVPLTVAIANVGAQDITGIRGQLSMPLALSAPDGSRSASADAEDNAVAGQTFYLTFFVDVSPHTRVGDYRATVSLDYSRIRESGARNEAFDFEFRITGDSVINAVPREPFITSLRENTAVIDIANTGTAAVSGVRVSVQEEAADQQVTASGSMTNIENVVISESSWDLGNIASGSSKSLVATVYVPSSLRDEVLSVPLEISYLNAHGDAQSVVRMADFYVRGLIDARIYDVRVNELGTRSMIVGDVINEGNEDALFGFVTLIPKEGSNIVGRTQFIDEIEVESPVPFSIPVEFAGAPRYGEHDIRIEVRYKDSTREEIVIDHETAVMIAPPSTGDEFEGEGVDILPLMIGAAAAVGATVFVRRRRSRRAARVQ